MPVKKDFLNLPSSMPDGVTGNTSDFGSEESRFEPWSGNKKSGNIRTFLFYMLYILSTTIFLPFVL